MSSAASKRELLLRRFEGRVSAEERAQVNEWLRTDAEARAFLRELAEQAVMIADIEREALGRQEALHGRATPLADAGRIGAMPGRPTSRLVMRTLLAVAASTIVVLAASLYFQQPAAEPHIAKVSGTSGAVEWTGDGGQVVRDFDIGTELSSGTIEGLAPGSWFELEFNDGSTVAISGSSMLTFSDAGQKKLHLKEGNASGKVKPQPTGKPMLIYTRSAVLEAQGARFEVEAELAFTMLNVSKGTVRIKRLTDGATADVPAKHRVIAAADREMSPVPGPASVNGWRSQLHLGPGGTQGNWSPKTEEQDAKLGAVPFTTRLGKTIYTVSFGVSCGDRPPVTLLPGARLLVRGRMASSERVFFGVTVRQSNGEFAGNFQTVRPAGEFPGGQAFERVFDFRDFRLDPSLSAVKNRLPSDPFHSVVESVWCHTLDKQAGLEIAEVELISPIEGE